MAAKNNKYFLAVYNDKDRCIGIFDDYTELVNSKILGDFTRQALWEMSSHYLKNNPTEVFRTVENGITFCSQKIFEYAKKKSSDERFNKRKYNYSLYKFWEGEEED